MNTQNVIKEITSLINLGEKVLETKEKYSPTPGILNCTRYVNNTLSTQWMTSSLSFVTRTFGKNSVQYEQLMKENKWKHGIRDYEAESIQGILLSIKFDVENGFLDVLERKITIDLFSDLLEMDIDEDNYCLMGGYLGMLLETHLRKVCASYDISFTDKDTLEAYNMKLYQKEIYDKGTLKQITAYGDLRNACVHNKWEGVDIKNVIRFKDWLNDFIGKPI